MRKALLKGKYQELQEHTNLLAEKEKEILAHEKIHVMLTYTIKNVITAFPPDARQADEDSLDKVTRLTKIA